MQFETFSVIDLGRVSKRNQPETRSAHKQHSLLTSIHIVLLAPPKKLAKMQRRLLKRCHYSNGLPFLSRRASKLQQVSQTCTPCSLSSHRTTSVLDFQRCHRNAFSYTHRPLLLSQVGEGLYAEMAEPKRYASTLQKRTRWMI